MCVESGWGRSWTSRKLFTAPVIEAAEFGQGAHYALGLAVVARPDGLWLSGTTPLVPLPDGSFRVGSEEWGPERVRFDLEINGRPQRMNFSGADLLRV